MTQEFVTLPREVVEQALEALSLALSDVDWRKDSPTQPVIHKAYNATCSALEQPHGKQEPVAWIRGSGLEMLKLENGGRATVYASDGMSNHSQPLYTHPQPKREDVILKVIQRLNQNPYSLTKSECIDLIKAMRTNGIGGDA